MEWLVVCLLIVIAVLAGLLYLIIGIFRVSVLERRNHRHEELEFLGKIGISRQTVFFGDSITHYCPVEEMYAEYTQRSGLRVYNRGIASETSEDALRRLDGSVLALDPMNLVILLGCNDIGKKIPIAQTIRNIEEIITRTRKKNPGIHIILQAVYPIREMGNSLPAKYLIGGRTCKKIRTLNKELKALAERQRVQFVDMTDLLAGEDGQLKQEYTMDGLHVNEQAYQKIANRLISVLETGKEEEYAG